MVDGGAGMRPRQKTALYRFYGSDGDLLYVGITNNVQRRMESHKSRKPWWWLSARIEIAWFECRDDALQAESVAIRDEGPLFNEAMPQPRSEFGGVLEIRECVVCGCELVTETFVGDDGPADAHERCDESRWNAHTSGWESARRRYQREEVYP